MFGDYNPALSRCEQMAAVIAWELSAQPSNCVVSLTDVVERFVARHNTSIRDPRKAVLHHLKAVCQKSALFAATSAPSKRKAIAVLTKNKSIGMGNKAEFKWGFGAAVKDPF